MAERDYFTEEQLERRVTDSRAAISYIKRKILIEQAAVSVVLIYIFVGTEARLSFTWIPMLVNSVVWLFWMSGTGNTFLALSRSTEHQEVGLVDEYRRLSYQLARQSRLEALFDFLTGLQFWMIGALSLARFLPLR